MKSGSEGTPPKNQLAVLPKGHTINLNKEMGILLEYFGINPKKDRLAFSIFLHVLSNNLKGGVKTKEIVETEGVTQAAAVYHLNKFLEKGLVIKRGTRYFLRGETIEETVDELKKDFLRKAERMKKVAKRVDDFIL